MEYLTTLEVIQAWRYGKGLQYNAKINKGDEAGWLPYHGDADDLLAKLAFDCLDFRLKPKHVYKRGDVVRVRSVRKGEGRVHGAFSFTGEAFFAIVVDIGGNDGSYRLLDGEGSIQLTHRRDFEPVNIE